jgi:hypothetical protein
MKKTLFIVALFVAVVVAGLLAQYSMSGRAPTERETFMQKEIGAPTGGSRMGPYDGMSTAGASGWLPNEKVPEGSAPVGGVETTMFLANPKVNSSCCPSAFNTDQGCVCLSDDERRLMGSRGGNRA